MSEEGRKRRKEKINRLTAEGLVSIKPRNS
jgi:hypothetical protein